MDAHEHKFTDCELAVKQKVHNLCISNNLQYVNMGRMEWRLRQVMADAGLTQEKMAELLDCSKSQVSMLLSGDRKFHSDWIDRISNSLNIPAWYLFVDPKALIDDFDRELISRFHGAKEYQKMSILDTLSMSPRPQNAATSEPMHTFHDLDTPSTNFVIDKGKKPKKGK